MDPLIDHVGPRGLISTGIDINAVVADALTENGWCFEHSRSRNQVITLLKNCVPDSGPIMSSEADDTYVWYSNGQNGAGNFSTSETWRALFPSTEVVFWHQVVWFSGRIPKHAFLSWIAARDRMVTRDRLLRWGLQVHPNCVLCVTQSETRQHLFFDCPFSHQVWSFFTAKLNLSPPHLFDDGLRWLKHPSRDNNVKLIVKLLYQACLYFIWKERNDRIHSNGQKRPAVIINEIKQLLRLRLDPLARAQRLHEGEESVLATWLRVFAG